MISKLGLFTPYTLRFHSDYYRECPSSLLKRSVILFDQLVFVNHNSKSKIFIEDLVRKETNNNFNEIMDCFQPVSHFVDTAKLLSFKVNDDSNLWYGPGSEDFLKFMKGYVSKRFDFDADNVKNAEEYDLLDFYVTAMSADFDYLFQLSKYNKEFSALYTKLHGDSYNATYAKIASTPEEVLRKVASINYFDFAKLTWQQILELKRSNFLQDFRKQFFIWLQEYEVAQNKDEFEAKLDSFMNSSKFAFLKSNRPVISKEIGKVLINNLPLNFVNPISVYSDVKSILGAVNTKQKLGWLFFIQEAFDFSTENSKI